MSSDCLGFVGSQVRCGTSVAIHQCGSCPPVSDLLRTLGAAIRCVECKCAAPRHDHDMVRLDASLHTLSLAVKVQHAHSQALCNHKGQTPFAAVLRSREDCVGSLP